MVFFVRSCVDAILFHPPLSGWGFHSHNTMDGLCGSNFFFWELDKGEYGKRQPIFFSFTWSSHNRWFHK